MNNLRNLALWIVIALLLVFLFNLFQGTSPHTAASPVSYSKFTEMVVENQVRPVETRERIVVGATLPEEVELRAVPPDWGPTVTQYRYVYTNDHVVLVEPSSRKVVQIVE